ncbi:MAG: glycosyltransferase family 2 protein [Planctomycetes bacterium]|nr:glycosyltransferase family 2 protein [Planctomycetota bacterium]
MSPHAIESAAKSDGRTFSQRSPFVKLSVVIPVFNEARTLREIVARVLSAPVNLPIELVLVDDGSTDGTLPIYDELVRQHAGRDLRVLRHERNQGKGAALRTGFGAATGDIVLVQDADLEYDPADYPRLLAPILQGKADVVYGSRFVGGQAHRVLLYWHMVGNKLLTTLSNALTNLNLTDMETCYKVFRAEVVKSITIRSDRFDFEPEMTAKVARGGWRVYEVGISYAGRDYAEGKKITWVDGLKAIAAIVRYRFFD